MAEDAVLGGLCALCDANSNNNYKESIMSNNSDYRDGTDLILSVDAHALGHSTECKVSYKAESGTRKTKEARMGKWQEKYVKTLGCTLSASGFVHSGDAENGLPSLRNLYLQGKPIDASWSYRDEPDSTYGGKFVITALEESGKAGDDETYSITLENSGAVGPISAQENANNDGE